MKNEYRIRDLERYINKLECNGFAIGIMGIYPKEVPGDYPTGPITGKPMSFGYTVGSRLHLHGRDNYYSKALKPFQAKAVLLLAASNIEDYIESQKSRKAA